LLKMNF